MQSSLDYDVLIVGGGMAGLTAAAYLSKAGLKVLLCEKESTDRGTGQLVRHTKDSFSTAGSGPSRTRESSSPMLRQLGIEVDFLPSPVSIGIGNDVVTV